MSSTASENISITSGIRLTVEVVQAMRQEQDGSGVIEGFVKEYKEYLSARVLALESLCSVEGRNQSLK